MTQRENALEIIRFGRPEWVATGIPQYALSYHGCDHEGYDGGGHECPVGTRWTDVWGVGWHKEQDGVMGFPVEHPLDDPERLAGYAWPNPDDPRLIGRVERQRAEFTGGDVLLSGSHRDTLWEKAYMLVGMERLMESFFAEPAFARRVLRGIMDFHVGLARHYLAAGVEIVSFSDDLGTQGGPLLGPAIVDEFLLPEYRRLFGLYREAGVLINFHSCGCIGWMIPRFIELGVNVLNPVQATANDLPAIRQATQGKIALHGGVSSGLIMSESPEKIRREVRRRLWQLGREGGYFCAPDQGMPYPPENLRAMHDAVVEFGRYPLEPA